MLIGPIILLDIQTRLKTKFGWMKLHIVSLPMPKKTLGPIKYTLFCLKRNNLLWKANKSTKLYWIFFKGTLFPPACVHPTPLVIQKCHLCIWRCIPGCIQNHIRMRYYEIRPILNKIWFTYASLYVIWMYPETRLWNVPWMISEQHHCPNIIWG